MIATRLKLIVLLTAAAFAAMAGAAWYQGGRVTAAMERADELRRSLDTLSELRMASVELVLAAMDSIIDREAGEVLPERQAVIDDGVGKLRAGAATLRELARELGQGDRMRTFAADVDELALASQSDLPRLIRDGTELDDFAVLDDAIDGAGERVADTLKLLAGLSDDRLEAQHVEAASIARLSQWLQVAVALLALVMITPFIVLVSRSITSALGNLQASMAGLAQGQLESAVFGLDREDEIGVMARAVEGFRLAGIEQQQVESEAAAQRTTAEAAREATEAERCRVETIQLQASEQQALVVQEVGKGLSRLSQGDLTHRIETDFPGEYRKLKDDFNTVKRSPNCGPRCRRSPARPRAS